MLSNAQIWSPLPLSDHVCLWADDEEDGPLLRRAALEHYRQGGLIIRGQWLRVTAEMLAADLRRLASAAGVALATRTQRAGQAVDRLDRLVEATL